MKRLLIAGALLAGPALAEPPKLKNTEDAHKVLSHVYQILDGQEIPVEGAVGTTFGEALYLVDQHGRYRVTLDAGRQVRKQLEGCKVNPFVPDQSNCRGVGMAEVRADWEGLSLSEGVAIELIVYELEVTRSD